MTRDEHVAWCKQRALEYLAANDLHNAVASMASDMDKHPECTVSPYLTIAGVMAVAGGSGAVREWVEGFR